ncbi:signal transduction histidine kinase [Stackebrandtia albiflava]|uniref:histidine kinase n=1 Tax=Stackebrandtia albiflava TaxID=406432 RepID=A0A562VCC7_9ACTN|nr:HAMP domain-containing sensor histidine kinase [Stackebrandtia albiflava]TWJ15545.1 signal transduction histidine kinase [Stackebrandtia albiflava]
MNARLTIRARLTLVYGGLLLVAGVAVLGITYALVSRRDPEPSLNSVDSPVTGVTGPKHVDESIEDTWRGAMDALMTQGAIAVLLVSAVAVAAGWVVAGRLLRPLHRITETARRIADAPAADRGLHERIGAVGPADEIKELADTFDLMLARLDQSFDGQRRFIGNASHELRTPLAVNRALLELALRREPDSSSAARLAETLLEVNGRHERLIQGLLLLVRSDREVTEPSYVDLADIVDHVVATVSPNGPPIDCRVAEAATTGDPVLLEHLVRNLVENAARYNRPVDGWVTVTGGTDADGRAVLTVENPGPVVAPSEVATLFEPFRRLDRSDSSNAGLGLSIVQAIARAHRGTVTAEARTDGGGMVFTVVLPPPPPE